MIIGLIVIYANPNYFSAKVDINCSYWFFWCIVSFFVFLLYMMFLISLKADINSAKRTIRPGVPGMNHKMDTLDLYFEGGITAFLLLTVFVVLAVLASRCYYHGFI
jgi:uncharacterized membrane protein YhaH (DUF805 family)